MQTKISFFNIAGISSLIVGNTLPLIGKIFWGWSTFYFLLLYWADTAIIFFFTYLKMRKAEGLPDPKAYYVSNKSKEEKLGNYLFIGLIFLIVLGGQIAFFTFVIGSKYWHNANTSMILPSFDIQNYGVMLALFIIGNILNFWSFIKNEDYKTVSVEEAQGWVFARILLIFVVVFIGFFVFGPGLIVSIVPLCIFIVLKNIGDILVFLSTLQKKITINISTS